MRVRVDALICTCMLSDPNACCEVDVPLVAGHVHVLFCMPYELVGTHSL
jgi:hypothetical protein